MESPLFCMATRKNILVVNPWIQDFAAYDLWVKPLALLYIASFLRKFCSVNFIDCLEGVQKPGMRIAERLYGCRKFLKEEVQKPKAYRFMPRRYSRYGIPLQDFKKRLEKISKPDLVLVGSMMTYWYEGVFTVIKILKEMFPGVPVVLGGKYAEICHDHALRNSGSDEVTRSGNFRDVIHTLNARGVACGCRSDFGDDEFPSPAWELYPDLRYICILTSAGCPFRCTYCYAPISGRSYISRSPESVLSEMEYWNKARGVKNFAFYDDALNFDAEKRLKPILRKIIEKKLDVYLHTPNALHAKWVDDELAELMRESGFKTVRLGIETSDDDLNRKLGGKISRREFEKCTGSLIKAGFSFENLGAYLLAGIPGQKHEDLIRDIDYLLDLGVRPYITEFSPIPGTPLFEEAKKISRMDLNEPLCQNNSILPLANPEFEYSHLVNAKDYLRSKLGDFVDDNKESD